MGKMKHIVAYVTGGANDIGKAVNEKILCQRGKVVRIEKDVIESLKCARSKFGGINVLVNSAGVTGYESIYDFKMKKPHSTDLFKRVFDVNVWGLFNVTRLAIGLMAKNMPDVNKQRGVIVNVSSSMDHEPPPGLVAYGATKSAVPGMTVPLARGVAEKGIRVVGIAPSFTDISMTASITLEDKKKWIAMNLTPKRFGTCDEVAQMLSRILSTVKCYELTWRGDIVKPVIIQRNRKFQ